MEWNEREKDGMNDVGKKELSENKEILIKVKVNLLREAQRD